MDFLVAAGIGLLILGLLSKIKDLFRGLLEGIEYRIRKRRGIQKEIDYMRSRRECIQSSLSADQKKQLADLDRKYIRSGEWNFLDYLNEESQIIGEITIPSAQ